MDITDRVEAFYNSFALEKGVIGYSLYGKPIYYFCVEKTAKPVIIATYAIHAREYITAYLALKQINDFISRGERGTVFFLPLVNPDGVKIALNHNPLYKANGRGVDLNVNFDARWGTGKKNVFYPAEENYVGKSPFSEPETRALKDFTLAVKPDITLSYHAKGEEIYYEFFQTGERLFRDERIVVALAACTGYKAKRITGSAGGYKDWCIENLKIPSFTIEVGGEELSHPIGEEHAEEIFVKNANVFKVLTENEWN